jgi:hypothetical protein
MKCKFCGKQMGKTKNYSSYCTENYCSDECYDKELKEYEKGKVWKQFLKQKVFEIGIIPLSLLLIGFFPYFIGDIVLNKTFHINWLEFCLWNYTSAELKASCTNNPTIWIMWIVGLIIIVAISAFIIYNWKYAKYKIEEDFQK